MAAYNPVDTVQQKFLAAIALGETGGASNAYTIGNGGKDLSGYSTDQYGFPIWEGVGNSHAAGAYQFQPGTWKAVASQYGLDFSNPADQNAGAWYDAEREFKDHTGGDLYQALSSGQYDIVQNALGDEWTSVNGNASNPGGLANALKNGIGAQIIGGFTNALGIGSPGANTGSGGGLSALVGNVFIRAALVLVGVIIVIAALWHLLASQGVVPSASDVAGTAVKAAAVL